MRNLIKGVFSPVLRESELVRPRYGSMPAASRYRPGVGRMRPVFSHIGKKREGHRANGRWIKGGWERAPKVKQHLRGVPQVRGWTHPVNRIARWYIQKDDEVRLLVGRDDEKYEDPRLGPAGGWKVYKVKDVAFKTNRVYLEGLPNIKERENAARPTNWDEMPPEDQRSWQQKHTVMPKTRPVQISNLSLLFKKHDTDPSQHVWAVRMKTSAPKWDPQCRGWRWARYATALLGPVSEERGPHGWIMGAESKGPARTPIQDRRARREKLRNAKDLQARREASSAGKVADVTEAPIVRKRSSLPQARLHDVASIAEDRNLIPITLREPLPKNQNIADEYLISTPGRPDYELIDNLMPLYLGEELSPRFAKNKIAAVYRARQHQLEQERAAYGSDAVAEWIANGRDEGLREIMESPLTNLSGAPLRKRNAREVREAAYLEFDMMRQDQVKEVSSRLRKGWKWDYGKETWIAGTKQVKFQEKMIAKEKKAEKIKRRLEGLKLRPKGNMVVPPHLRA